MQTTLRYTEWYTAAQTSFSKTSIALWNGRRAGTCYSTLPNVCSCQSPGVGVHSTTHTSCTAIPLTVFSAKYLCITIQQDIDWDNHINNVVNKANRSLDFLRRSLKINSSAIKEKTYKAFVRPILEYASSAWHPYTQKNIDKSEAVRRRTARFVLNRYNTSSVHRTLDSLRWPSLEQRRKTSRLGVMYRTYNGLVQCPIIKTKLVPPPPLPLSTALPHHYQNTVQRWFLSTPHHQALEFSLQGCSGGDDCRHFCATRFPLASQLVLFKDFLFCVVNIPKSAGIINMNVGI